MEKVALNLQVEMLLRIGLGVRLKCLELGLRITIISFGLQEVLEGLAAYSLYRSLKWNDSSINSSYKSVLLAVLLEESGWTAMLRLYMPSCILIEF